MPGGAAGGSGTGTSPGTGSAAAAADASPAKGKRVRRKPLDELEKVSLGFKVWQPDDAQVW